jgi:hypothetical protein
MGRAPVSHSAAGRKSVLAVDLDDEDSSITRIQATESERAVACLRLGPEVAEALQQFPMKGSLDAAVLFGRPIHLCDKP